MKVGLGLVSYGRPEYRAAAIEAIEEHCHVDHFEISFDVAPVAKAKNAVLTAMLDAGCDWLIVAEDDVLPVSPDAIDGYVRACESSGYGHLVFHVHGNENARPRWTKPDVSSWPNSFAPWAIYSREALKTCGLFDEKFVNCWEHIEHTQRLASKGFTAPWPDNLDATGSERWLVEQSGANHNTSIERTPEYWEHFERGREYWRTEKPETFRMIWP